MLASKNQPFSPTIIYVDICYQFRVPRNLRIDIKDRLEEYSQSIEIDIHDCTQTQKSQLPPCLRFGFAPLIHVNQDYSRLPTDLVFNLFWIRQLDGQTSLVVYFTVMIKIPSFTVVI